MPKKIAVSIKNLTKKYVLRQEKPTLVETLFRKSDQKTYTAVDDVSLTVYRGEKVGIVGPNGAGKTTLLKLIGGITVPTSGAASFSGKVVTLINLEAGFHPYLNGIDNIFLNGLLIGMRESEVKRKLDEIIEFANIGEFINAPLYTYSYGMIMRLGFAVGVAADPDILVLDESISVGDTSFQHKTMMKLNEFHRKNKTIIVVTHWLEYLIKNCSRIIVMDGGKIIADGGVDLVIKYQAEKQRAERRKLSSIKRS